MAMEQWTITSQVYLRLQTHHCPDDKIRVASHSLGARVVLSALQTLAENTTTNNNNSD
jgi:hypothetical protein